MIRTLIVTATPPGSIQPWQLPGLARLSHHARRSPCEGLEASLAGRFGWNMADGGHAALCLLGEGDDPGEHCWMHASLVHLRPGQRQLLLLPAAAAGLDPAQGDELLHTVTGHLDATGWHWRQHGQALWLRVETEAVRDHPPHALPGAALTTPPLAGPGAGPLRTLTSELEMLLGAHPCNQRREAAGQPPVNAVWLWGWGPLPRLRPPATATVHARPPLARGLARAAGMDQADAPLAELACLALPETPADAQDLAAAWRHLDVEIFQPAARSSYPVALLLCGARTGCQLLSHPWRRRLPWPRPRLQLSC